MRLIPEMLRALIKLNFYEKIINIHWHRFIYVLIFISVEKEKNESELF